MNDNNVNNAGNMFVSLFMLIAGISLLFTISYKILDFNTFTRKENRIGNITSEEVDSTRTEYESYMGQYDGTYTPSEVLTSIENNHENYNIYICTDSTRVELHERTYEGKSLEDYLTQGYIKEVKDVVYGGYTDTTAKFLCYLDITNKGDIKSIYYYRKAV